jgi:hypothetical protein
MKKHESIIREERGLRRCGWYVAVGFPAMGALGEWLRPGYWPAFVPMVVFAVLLLILTEWRWRPIGASLHAIRNPKSKIQNRTAGLG